MNLQQIKEAIKGLSASEIEALRGWIEEYLEEKLELTDGFATSIERGRCDLSEGRTRQTTKTK